MRKYLLLLLLIVIISACKKSGNTSIAVSSVLLQSSNFTSSNGTGFTSVYQYDGNNRLINILEGNTFNIPLVYDTQGKLISYGQIGAGQELIQFFYDGNGNLINGTIKDYDGSSRVNYSYSFTCTITNGEVSQMVVYNLLSSTPTVPEQISTNTYDGNGNLIKQITTDHSGALLETDTYTFGTNHSPKLNLHLRFNISPFLDSDFFNINETATAKADVPQSIYPSITTYSPLVTYQYQYKSGYPTRVFDGQGSTNTYNYSGL